MNLEELRDIMNERGFSSTLSTTKGEYMFISNDPITERHVLCEINLEELTFKFIFAIPYTTFKLVSSTCIPVTDSKHFTKTLQRFMTVIDKLLFSD